MGNLTHHEVFTRSFAVLMGIWPNLIQMALIYWTKVSEGKCQNFWTSDELI